MLEFHKVDPAGKEWKLKIHCGLSDGGCLRRSEIVYSKAGRKIYSRQTKRLTTAELKFIGGWEDDVFTCLAYDLGMTILIDCVERPRWEQVWIGAVFRPDRISELHRNPEDREDPGLWDDRPDWEDVVESEAKLGRERGMRKEAMEAARLAARERIAIKGFKACRRQGSARATAGR
jgi:hypothetical protein